LKRSRIFRRRSKTVEMSVWRLQALFYNFKAILELNNTALARMAEMEQALGGEYIFDRPYLEDSVRRISSLVHHAVYCLNALTRNSYVSLYDRYQDILVVLDAILAGGSSGRDAELVMPLEDIGWELEPMVGIEAVCLSELGRHAGVRVARGAVLTAAGVDGLLGRALAGEVVGATREMVETALAGVLGGMRAEQGAMHIVGVRAGENFAEAIEDIPRDLFSVEVNIGQLGNWGGGADGAVAAARELAVRIEREARTCAGSLAVLMLIIPPAAVSGMARSRAPEAPELLAVEARQTGADKGDAFLMRRTHPFDLIRSKISPRPGGSRFADGRRATDPLSRSLGRGSALITPPALKSLAETAMALERMLGTPVEAHWQEAAGEACIICRVQPRPMHLEAPSGRQLADEMAGATVLVRGGQLVQSGVVAGMAMHVREDTPLESFPLGAVAVAKTASPRLTPILRMASAVITENGTAAGHLATVARELRLPAIFGMPEAMRLIPDGQGVTVDAGAGTVYDGFLEFLLRHGAAGGDLNPTDPEYRMLRRLLRFIMPLHLVDPDAPGFTGQGCRTMHDILHFCHDRAVDELAHFQERRPGLGTIRSRRLHAGVPLDVRVLDVGGGIDASAGDQARVDEVRSAPLVSFLRGLNRSSAWSDGASALALGDIIANLPRTMGMLEDGGVMQGASLAIVGADYLNLSLRMGYHFSVVDSYLGPDQSRNYVYFRFAGGLAAGKSRERRARFIAHVLEHMDFLVTREGDLVVGRLKLAEDECLRVALEVLGSLTAYCRQMDTLMRDDSDIGSIFDDFSEKFMRSFVPMKESAESVGTAKAVR